VSHCRSVVPASSGLLTVGSRVRSTKKHSLILNALVVSRRSLRQIYRCGVPRNTRGVAAPIHIDYVRLPVQYRAEKSPRPPKHCVVTHSARCYMEGEFVNTSNQKHPSPKSNLGEKIERAIIALAELGDDLPEGDDRNATVEQIKALNVEYQAKPISLSALKKVCTEVSKLLARLKADGRFERDSKRGPDF
jgi:hypothetical protein